MNTTKENIMSALNYASYMLLTSGAALPMKVFADGDAAGGGAAGGNADCDLSGMTISNGKLVTGCENGGNMDATANTILGKEQTLVSVITAVAAGIMVIIFIIKAVQLAKSGDNPSERSRAITALIVLFIAIALLGSISLFSGLAFNLFK